MSKFSIYVNKSKTNFAIKVPTRALSTHKNQSSFFSFLVPRWNPFAQALTLKTPAVLIGKMYNKDNTNKE